MVPSRNIFGAFDGPRSHVYALKTSRVVKGMGLKEEDEGEDALHSLANAKMIRAHMSLTESRVSQRSQIENRTGHIQSHHCVGNLAPPLACDSRAGRLTSPWQVEHMLKVI
jgi:hypothetical protein